MRVPQVNPVIAAQAIEANALADAIRDAIRPMLAGRDPSVQGAAMADLLAMWLAGHAPALREELLDEHLKVVRELIVVNEHLMFGDAGHPAKDFTP